MKSLSVSKDWIQKAISWADQHFDHFSYHQHNDISYPHQGFRHLLAVGAKETHQLSIIGLEGFRNKNPDQWLFGYLGYDLKNELHGLKTTNPDHLGFSDIYFFRPQYLFEIIEDQVILLVGDQSVFEQIHAHQFKTKRALIHEAQPEFDKETYVETVKKLIEHIISGDFYEINFCQGFFGSYEQLDLTSLYLRLNELSPKPFSCLQKFKGHAILCASPERFLKKNREQLISQPIKGTRPRASDKKEDERLKVELRNDEKELAENMMIVDLVRNDLARSAVSGSVKVEEMFGIYSFEQVHQMISTVTAQLKENVTGIEAISKAFPMGSMTGAPKRKVMELTEVYERSKRGAFSGASGYLQPDGDFDFNVLIRSLFINLADKKYSFHVGSAITYDAKPESEFEECFIKAKALLALIQD